MRRDPAQLIFFGAIAACISLFSRVSAQDPGDRDSIVISDVYVENTVDFINVPAYFVTDDSVAAYNIPLEFSFTGQGIGLDHVEYVDTYYNWDDDFSDYLVADSYLRMIGIYDTGEGDNEPLFTDLERIHYLNLVFAVEPGAPDQIGLIDTTYDEINGSAFFGLNDGITEFAPAVIPGRIYFGQVEPVPTLSEWGTIIFSLLIVMLATIGVIRNDNRSAVNDY